MFNIGLALEVEVAFKIMFPTTCKVAFGIVFAMPTLPAAVILIFSLCVPAFTVKNSRLPVTLEAPGVPVSVRITAVLRNVPLVSFA